MELDEQISSDVESTGIDTTDAPSFSFETVISRFEVTVFSLAMNLTNDLSASALVVEQVFLRLSREAMGTSDEELERLVHSFTYDAAITALVDAKRPKVQ